jgi:hypothetical protein
MEKLKSFEQFVTAKTEADKIEVQEQNNNKRQNEAETFKTLLAEFDVTSVKELTEEQRSEFFERLRGVEMNESFMQLNEGTRGQFGKIDKKGNIVSVYTHYDSYPENMLPLIKKGYMKGQNVDAVLQGGNSSGLEADPDSMNFYGEDDQLNGNVKSFDRYVRTAANDWGAEYVYLWDERSKEWMMADLYGGGQLRPAFESVVNEAIKVTGKRDAKKVVTQYNKILMGELSGIGASGDEKTILGAVKKLFVDAMEDANFHREKDACATAIKGNIASIPVIVDGLGKMAVNIGATRIKAALEEYYSRISNAAGWSGLAIVEGTALFLEQLGFAQMGQDLMDKFNAQFEGNAVTVNVEEKLYEYFVKLDEAEVKSDEDFKEYAFSVLQKAFGEDFDEAKAQEVVDGLISKHEGDYGAMVGALQSSLG